MSLFLGQRDKIMRYLDVFFSFPFILPFSIVAEPNCEAECKGNKDGHGYE